jgi:hypothetical protein
MTSLPRLLTLWFTFTELNDGITEPSESLKKFQSAVNETIDKLQQRHPVSMWYVCISQLVSRTGHPNSKTLGLITQIVQKTLELFPKQTLWHIAGMLHSSDGARKSSGKALVRNAINSVQQHKKTKGTDDDLTMLQQADGFFKALIELSTFRPDDKSKSQTLQWSLAKTYSMPTLARFAIPTQSSLSMRLPTRVLPDRPTDFSYFTSDLECIESFSPNVTILASKARPKILEMTTTHGNVIKVSTGAVYHQYRTHFIQLMLASSFLSSMSTRETFAKTLVSWSSTRLSIGC